MKKLKYLIPIILSLAVLVTIFIVSQIPAKAEVVSGTCGENLTWELDESTGVLTISGSGDMYSYYTCYGSGGFSWKTPWYEHSKIIKTVIISNGVTSIGGGAFTYCENLTTVAIPDSVTYIGCGVFDGCTKLECNEYNNGYYLGNEINPYVVLFKVKSTSIKTFDIYENTEFIYENAFSACSGLTSITIPDSVTSIGDYAFYDCSSLGSIIIPNSVTSIGHSVFEGCSGLTSIIIPDSVTSIGNGVFNGCTGLVTVNMGNGTDVLIASGQDSVKTVYISSANAVKNITSSSVYPYCEDLYIESSITDVPIYIKTTYPYTTTVVENGVTYTRYSLNEIKVETPEEPDNSETPSDDKQESGSKNESSTPSDTTNTPTAPEESKDPNTVIIIIAAVAVIACGGMAVAMAVILKKKR